MDGQDGAGNGNPQNAGTAPGNKKILPKPKKMTSLKYKLVLKRKLTDLVESIVNLETLMNHLYAKGVISVADGERIRAHVTTESKIFDLMGVVMRKGEKAYDILMTALLKTGNEHVRDDLVITERELQNENTDGNNERRKKKNKSGKPGKMFTIYDATFTDSETSSDEESGNLERFDPDTASLFDLLVYIEWCLRIIKYHPQKLYNFSRFDSTNDLVPVYPTKTFNKSLLRFRVNRTIFLKSIGLYGPAETAKATYLVEIKLIVQIFMDDDFTIAEAKGIYQMDGNGQITFVEFEKTHPIRPHTWHFIEFSIKGQEKMAIQPEKNIEFRREASMIDGEINHGNVVFEFDHLKSTGQIPELRFFRGKDVVDFYYPKQHLSGVYTAKRFDSVYPTRFSDPIQEFNKSVQRFRVDRPIFLKAVGFFGPGNPTNPDEGVASYKIKLKLMAWKEIDEPCILKEVDELMEVKCEKMMYITFKDASKITPHTWHWIEFTIIGSVPVGQNDQRKQFVPVKYGEDIDDGGVKFEFDTSVENSTSQMPELCFYKANDASVFSGDKYLQILTPDAQTFYTAYRFTDSHPFEIPVVPFLRFQKSCQRFKVNRTIYLKKVGFFGPATPGCTATYEVKMKLVLWSTKSPPFVIASTEKVVEVEHSKTLYVSFQKAQPIRPHIWHWIEFSIKGTEAMIIQSKMNKKEEDTVYYQFGGNVKFQFDTTPCHSTCQMPELWFFKGENEIDLSRFPKPTINTNAGEKKQPCKCTVF